MLLTLIQELKPNQSTWDIGRFQLPPRPTSSKAKIKALSIKKNTLPSSSSDPTFRLDFQYIDLPLNRVLTPRQSHLYLHLSIAELRFPNIAPKDTSDYLLKVVSSGITLEGRTYRFFGNSNSQLKSRSCILIEGTDEEIDARIAALGDFAKIKSVAKRAKRIGLMFSSQEAGLPLRPSQTRDVEDIVSEKTGEVLSDGCGLISREFARSLAKECNIVVGGKLYVPSVFQMRYLGYKGVVCISESLDKENASRKEGTEKIHVEFRASMKKFKAISSEVPLFAVLDSSRPFSYGRLNGDIVSLLWTLGISTETLLAKQLLHLETIAHAHTSSNPATLFLSSIGRHDLVEKLLLSDEPSRCHKTISDLQEKEFKASLNKKGEEKVRVLVENSRLLFGVCDERDALREGEVFVRIEMPGTGVVTLKDVNVMVVRNPCLHPGDILKLRAVNRPGILHDQRAECIVFSGRGPRAAASMSSGGDLDGDKFFVCWDPDLIPTLSFESYSYPAGKKPREAEVSRADLLRHFIFYNVGQLARVKKLYLQFLRVSPEGAMSSECQELNALHSDLVDGAWVKIPDRLTQPPTPKATTRPFILDTLALDVKRFVDGFHDKAITSQDRSLSNFDSVDLFKFVTSESLALPEVARLRLVLLRCRRLNEDPGPYLAFVNWNALTAVERHLVYEDLYPFQDVGSTLWNSLVRSKILSLKDLRVHGLDGPLRLQKFFASTDEGLGLGSFFARLQVASSFCSRLLIVLKVDTRFSLIIYIPKPLVWGEDDPVGRGVRVLACLPSSDLGRHSAVSDDEFLLYIGPNSFQLFRGQRGDTFVYLRTEMGSVRISVALQKIDKTVQRHVGRLAQIFIDAAEIHVVSNRDRVGIDELDLAFSSVPTLERRRRIENVPLEVDTKTFKEVDWSKYPPHYKSLCTGVLDRNSSSLKSLSADQVLPVVQFSIQHRNISRALAIASFFIGLYGSKAASRFIPILESEGPILCSSLISRSRLGGSSSEPLILSSWTSTILLAVVRSANLLGDQALIYLERDLSSLVETLSVAEIVELIWRSSVSVRSPLLARDMVFALQGLGKVGRTALEEYVLDQATSLAIDYGGEVARSSKCDEFGVPRARPLDQLVHKPKPESQNILSIDIRTDARFPLRPGDHLRIRTPDDACFGGGEVEVFDCIVRSSDSSSAHLENLHPHPPQLDEASWSLVPCGQTTTTRAALDALVKLAGGELDFLRLADLIAGSPTPSEPILHFDPPPPTEALNDSQNRAVAAAVSNRLSLIWGPPGTGKTEVVAKMIGLFSAEEEIRILVASSTHNAVDTVLKRFLLTTSLDEALIVRVSTDLTKVLPEHRRLAVNPSDDDQRRNSAATKAAKEKIKGARVVFTTAAGAGLGLLKAFNDFDITIIDEASQMTEPVALIPIFKGSSRVVLVGDHVQLRPGVRPEGQALDLDRSLFERLWLDETTRLGLAKTMLDEQYRCGTLLNNFPSHQFYDGKLKSGVSERDRLLPPSSFPWPFTLPPNTPSSSTSSSFFPSVFIECDSPETRDASSSKKNSGQAALVKRIIALLQSESNSFSIALLSPYSSQTKALQKLNLPSCVSTTVDGVQGNEFEVVIFSTVRCNPEGEIGFLSDARRLNVAWTRARRGRIIVGHKATLLAGGSEFWKAALMDCVEVVLPGRRVRLERREGEESKWPQRERRGSREKEREDEVEGQVEVGGGRSTTE